MKSGRLFRLKLEEATFGGDTEPVLPIASTGFQTLHVNNLRSREIEADDEIAHNGNVYVVISKGQAFDNLAQAVEFTVSYERSDTPTTPQSDADSEWPDTLESEVEN